ncbi:PREDICTED: CASP-like protein 4A3 isoform X1 [Lupinus angustifolius]|uniref:CASP-like protein 4A3 isoform X1 n=1 Tax=Lupinus angustifolius TaxID=3871 RepID=UPI00092E7D97|nr:PREDICTED: CASP-like protein 4A3 isoform X1 [Lupinus angustifolius]
MKNSLSKNTESLTQLNSPHTPLQVGSSPRSDAGDPHSPPLTFHSPENSPVNHHTDNSRAITILGNSPQRFPPQSPSPSPLPVSNHHTEPENALPPEFVVNRAMRQEPQPNATNFDRPAGRGRQGGEDGGGGRGRGRATVVSPVRTKSVGTGITSKAALGFRLSEVVLCLISFSVMAADKTQGWSGDSFDRYKEYRYCLSMNVIAFAYAGFQACDLVYQLVTGKHMINHHLRYHFDFFMDQVLAYLLISASSSAATRVDDWQSNWGKDEFTEMASASIGLSFLAFIAFAISSLISGYNLSTVYP